MSKAARASLVAANKGAGAAFIGGKMASKAGLQLGQKAAAVGGENVKKAAPIIGEKSKAASQAGITAGKTAAPVIAEKGKIAGKAGLKFGGQVGKTGLAAATFGASKVSEAAKASASRRTSLAAAGSIKARMARFNSPGNSANSGNIAEEKSKHPSAVNSTGLSIKERMAMFNK